MARHCTSPRSTANSISAPALIADDDVEFCADGVLDQLGQVISGVAGAGAAALGRRRSAAHVVDRLVRSGRPHVEQCIRARGATDLGKFRSIELHFFAPQQLIEIKTGVDDGDAQAIRFGNAINVIGRHCRAGAGHVLNDHVRVSGNVLGQIRTDEPRPLVMRAAGGIADDEPNDFPLKVRSLRSGIEQTRTIERACR